MASDEVVSDPPCLDRTGSFWENVKSAVQDKVRFPKEASADPDEMSDLDCFPMRSLDQVESPAVMAE